DFAPSRRPAAAYCATRSSRRSPPEETRQILRSPSCGELLLFANALTRASRRDHQEDPEFRTHAALHFGRRMRATAISTSKTKPSRMVKAGTKLPVWSATKPAKAGPPAPIVEIKLMAANSSRLGARPK